MANERENGEIMGKDEVLAFLDASGVWYDSMEHGAISGMDDAAGLVLPYPQSGTKNLFLCDKKHREHFYIVAAWEEKKVDLNSFRRENGLDKLTFGTEEELMAVLGLMPGAVTPLGMLNDKERKTELYLDACFTRGDAIISMHPNVNTMTLFMKTADLITILEERGIKTHIVEI